MKGSEPKHTRNIVFVLYIICALEKQPRALNQNHLLQLNAYYEKQDSVTSNQKTHDTKQFAMFEKK